MQRNTPVQVILVGAGHRSEFYGKYALEHPDEMQVVGVAEPNLIRRKAFQELFHIPENNCFESADALARAGKFADAVINGTMDNLHVSTSIPLMRAGYDILIEKPFALNEAEMWRLYDVQKETGRKVMVCHVLRYAPFYQMIHEEVASGALGKVLSIEVCEYVSYHHMATCYVRGKWNRFETCESGMLLAKSCHDVDLMMWIKGTAPKMISSFGNLMWYRPENAPKDAGTRCMVDCPYVDSCDFSAKSMYINHPDRWKYYVWTELEGKKNPTIEDKIALLKGDSPFGRCVFKCDNDVVDHQTLSVLFEDGATGSLNMISGSGRDERTIRIVGAKAELFGCFQDNIYTIRTISAAPDQEFIARTVHPMESSENVGHGGGEQKLVEDFVKYVRGEAASPSLTSLEDSIYGHEAVFLAEKSRETGSTQRFKSR